MTQYLILIYGDESQHAQGTTDDWNQLRQGHFAFGDANEKHILGGNALEPVATATTIRHSVDRADSADRAGGEVTITDGPFAETKEALGGYYLIEAADLDEAIAIASKVPAPYGGVEVRPVWVLPSMD
jgi:hypothetical protein